MVMTKELEKLIEEEKQKQVSAAIDVMDKFGIDYDDEAITQLVCDTIDQSFRVALSMKVLSQVPVVRELLIAANNLVGSYTCDCDERENCGCCKVLKAVKPWQQYIGGGDG